ncbi:MAG: DUF4476 domain-containing protein [Alphaproteobacteria bacterium]|nr:DUF4476 domain-containing protein [Alphaproteobacteria bacterium]MCB9699281.1 DUF4476 domain-containing protein [Alphaproteobacteria bacterium]
MLWLLISASLAGTLRIQANSPVSYRLDGNYVGRMVMDATVPDLPYGHHLLEVVDALGNVLAQSDVLIEDLPVWFRYEDHRLDKLDPNRMSLAELGVTTTTISAQEMVELERDLARKSDKKRLKILVKAVDRYWFEMRHVDSLISAFDGLIERATAAILLAPKTVDPFKFAAIEDQFPPGEFRDRVRVAYLHESN